MKNNLPNYQHTILGCGTAILEYSRLCTLTLQYNPSWFRMNLRFLHDVIFPLLISLIAMSNISSGLRRAFLFSLSPLLPLVKAPLYWSSMTSFCTWLIYVKLLQIFGARSKPSTQSIYRSEISVNFIFPPRHSPPLPLSFHVFTGVTLHKHFFGWMNKIGKIFWGCMDSMHKLSLTPYYFPV